MSRIFTSIFLTAAFGLSACDQAIDDRYGGLVVVPVEEEVIFDSEPPTLVAAAIPPRRPDSVLGPIPIVILDDEDLPQPQEIVIAEDEALADLALAGAEASLSAAEQALAEERALAQAATLDFGLSETGQAVQDPDLSFGSNGSGGDVADLSFGSADLAPSGDFGSLAGLQEAQEQLALAQQEAARLAGGITPIANLEEDSQTGDPDLGSPIEGTPTSNAIETDLANVIDTASSNASDVSPDEGETSKVAQRSIFLPLSYDDGEPLITPSDLEDLYQEASYDLTQVIAGEPVPGLILQRLPERLGALNQSDRPLLKELFIKTALPLCLVSNERIRQERAYVLNAEDTSEQLMEVRDPVIAGLGAKYSVTTRRDLLKAVDTIPVSLCLAQAIFESRWSLEETSIKQNALFGGWVRGQTNADSAGPTEESLEEGALVSFASLQAATDAYALHLNRDSSFAEFRDARVIQHQEQGTFSGLDGAAFVSAYAPKTPEYADLLVLLIRENQLDQYDLAQLSGERTAVPVF